MLGSSSPGFVGPEFPRLSGRVGFMLRQFEIARSIRLRPYNALAFSAPIAVFVSVFLFRANLHPWMHFGVLRYGLLGKSSDGPSVGKDPETTDLLRY